MKKLVALFFVCLSLIFLQSPLSLTNISKNFNGTHSFFTTQKVSDENSSIIKNGNGYLISCESCYSPKLLSKLNLSQLSGESFCFNGTLKDIADILKSLEAQIVKTENNSSIYIIYAYSPKIFKSVFVENQKVNIQIAKKQELTTVGSPLILGSF